MHLWDHLKMHAMKKIFFLVLFSFVMAGFASAQTKRMSRHRNTTHFSADTSKKEIITSQFIRKSEAVEPDNRKEYMQDGQLATYTGHEATAINADQFQSIKKEGHQQEKENE